MADLPLSLLKNLNFGSFRNQIEQVSDIRVPHPHAAMARRLANPVFLVGAVNIDKTLAAIRVVRFKAIQPQDAAGD